MASRAGTRMALVALVALAASGLLVPPGNARSIGGTTLHDASSRQVAAIAWVLGRYRAAGLQLPPLDVAFRSDPDACRGGAGFYRDGHVDVCPGATTLVLLHEFAHAWSERALTDGMRSRFVAMRRLPTWDSWSFPWPLRGYEQVAQTLVWGLDGEMAPGGPHADDLDAYRFLTGSAPPPARSDIPQLSL